MKNEIVALVTGIACFTSITLYAAGDTGANYFIKSVETDQTGGCVKTSTILGDACTQPGSSNTDCEQKWEDQYGCDGKSDADCEPYNSAFNVDGQCKIVQTNKGPGCNCE